MEEFSVVTVGPPFSGKSSLARILAGVELPSQGKTTGVERHSVVLTVDSVPTKLEINEAPVRNINGRDYTDASRAVCRSADGFILVLPISDGNNTPQTAKQLIHDVSESYIHSSSPQVLGSRGEDIPYVMVGSKCDRELRDRQFPCFAMQRLAHELKRPYIETSATHDINVTLAFNVLVRMLRIKFRKRAKERAAAATAPAHNSGDISSSKTTSHRIPVNGESASATHFSAPLVLSSSPSASSSSSSSVGGVDDETSDTTGTTVAPSPRKHYNVIGKLLQKSKNKSNKKSFNEEDFSDWASIVERSRDGEMGIQCRSIRDAALQCQGSVLYTLLKRETAKAMSQASPGSSGGARPTIPALHTVLFDGITLLHLAAIWGYKSVAKLLLESSTANVYAKDVAGKTPLYRAAVNGQLKLLPMLLERVNPFDPQNQEALRIAFMDPRVLRPYSHEELLDICKDIVRTGFDMQRLCTDITDRKDLLTLDDTNGDGSDAMEQLTSQLAKGLSAMRIAMHDEKKKEQSGEGSVSPPQKEGKKKNDHQASVEGYVYEMADRFKSSVNISTNNAAPAKGKQQQQTQSQQVSYDLALAKELLQIATISSPNVRYQLAKLITTTIVSLLRQVPSSVTANNNSTKSDNTFDRTIVLLKLLHALTVDSDKARAYIGSTSEGGAIQPLVAISLVTPGGISGGSQTLYDDVQTNVALILSDLARCNNKNKDVVKQANGIFGITQLLVTAMKTSSDKLINASLKALRYLCENEGLASDILNQKTAVPRALELVKTYKKVPVKTEALKLLATVAGHDTHHGSLIALGVNDTLLLTVINNSNEHGKLLAAAVHLLLGLSKKKSWATKHGSPILTALHPAVNKVRKDRTPSLMRYLAEVYRWFAGIDAHFRVLVASFDVSVSQVPQSQTSISSSSPGFSAITNNSNNNSSNTHAQLMKLITTMQSTNQDQATRAATELLELIMKPSPSSGTSSSSSSTTTAAAAATTTTAPSSIMMREEALQQGAFPALWKLFANGKLQPWTGSWLPTINPETLEFKDKIGQGAFGSVYAGTLVNNSSSSNNTNNNNKVSVALKVLDEEQVQLEDFKSELVALSLLTGVVHNVVEFKGYCYFQQKISGKIDTTKSFHCLVMELMETSLEKIIFGKKRSKLSNFKRMKKVAFDIAQGMSKLHAFGILHRDLKPANILINLRSKSWDVKIADLGYARRDTLDSVRKSVVGTLVYLAPELMDHKKSLDVSKSTDVYSYGVLLWEMVHKRHAFEGVDASRLAYHIMTCRQSNQPPLTVSSDTDPALKFVIEGCLAYDPTLRPSFDDIKSSLWQALHH